MHTFYVSADRNYYVVAGMKEFQCKQIEGHGVQIFTHRVVKYGTLVFTLPYQLADERDAMAEMYHRNANILCKDSLGVERPIFYFCIIRFLMNTGNASWGGLECIILRDLLSSRLLFAFANTSYVLVNTNRRLVTYFLL